MLIIIKKKKMMMMIKKKKMMIIMNRMTGKELREEEEGFQQEEAKVLFHFHDQLCFHMFTPPGDFHATTYSTTMLHPSEVAFF